MRRRVLHRARRVVAFGVVGFLLGLAVAWGSVLFVGAGPTIASQNVGTRFSQSRYYTYFLLTHDSSWAADRYVVTQGRTSIRTTNIRVPPWAREWAEVRPSRLDSTATEWIEGRGWPARMCSFRVIHTREDRGDPQIPQSIRLYKPERFDILDGIALRLPRERLQDDRLPIVAIPFQPIARGVLLNTAAYGAAAWLLWWVGAGVRRMVRRRRGRCAACGYDVRGIAGRCPECGASVPRLGLAGAQRELKGERGC